MNSNTLDRFINSRLRKLDTDSPEPYAHVEEIKDNNKLNKNTIVNSINRFFSINLRRLIDFKGNNRNNPINVSTI